MILFSWHAARNIVENRWSKQERSCSKEKYGVERRSMENVAKSSATSGELQAGRMTVWRALFGHVRAPDPGNTADLVWLNHSFKFSGLTSL
jgi:hypothetical protein